MKKEYIKPTMEIINIETQYMLAASGVSFSSEDCGQGRLIDELAEEDEPAW